MTDNALNPAKMEKLARKLARAYAATGYDMGDLYNEHDYGTPTDAEWDAICNRAEEIAPTVRVSAPERQAWERAEREFELEVRAERLHLGPR